MQPALVREGRRGRRTPAACRARGWRARRRSARASAGTRATRAATQRIAELQLQIGDDRAEIGVAAALAEAVDGPLHLHGARLDRGERVGDRELGVVVAVDAERDADARRARRASRRRLRGHAAAAGVAEAEQRRARLRRRLQARERVLGIRPRTVEECSASKITSSTPLRGTRSCPRSGRGSRRAGRADRRVDVAGPRSADDRDHRRLRFEQHAEVLVLVAA